MCVRVSVCSFACAHASLKRLVSHHTGLHPQCTKTNQMAMRSKPRPPRAIYISNAIEIRNGKNVRPLRSIKSAWLVYTQLSKGKLHQTPREDTNTGYTLRTRPQPLLSRLLFAILVLGRLCCFGRLKVRGEEKVRFWDCRSIKMWERNVDISPEAQLTI